MSYKVYCPICGEPTTTINIKMKNEYIKHEYDWYTSEYIGCSGLDMPWNINIQFKCGKCQHLFDINSQGEPLSQYKDENVHNIVKYVDQNKENRVF